MTLLLLTLYNKYEIYRYMYSITVQIKINFCIYKIEFITFLLYLPQLRRFDKKKHLLKRYFMNECLNFSHLSQH